jgi:hypothetical protein
MKHHKKPLEKIYVKDNFVDYCIDVLYPGNTLFSRHNILYEAMKDVQEIRHKLGDAEIIRLVPEYHAPKERYNESN